MTITTRQTDIVYDFIQKEQLEQAHCAFVLLEDVLISIYDFTNFVKIRILHQKSASLSLVFKTS